MRLPGRICALYVVLVTGPYLLTFPPSGYGAIASWKFFWYVAPTTAFCAAILIWLARKRRLNELVFWKSPSRLERLTMGAMLAYLLFTALSGARSPFDGTFFGYMRYDGVLTVMLYVLSAFLLARYFEPKRWMAWVFAAAVVLTCLLGVAQLLGDNPFGLYPAGYNYYDAGVYWSGVFWGTVGNADLCGAVLSLSAGLFLALLARGRPKDMPVYAAALVCCSFSIMELNIESALAALALGMLLLPAFIAVDPETLSRLLRAYGIAAFGGALGLTVRFYRGGAELLPRRSGIALFALAVVLPLGCRLLLKTRGPRTLDGRGLRRALAVLAVAALSAALLAVYCIDGLPVTALAQAHEILHGNLDDRFGSGRIYIWKQVWQLIRERPLFGGGPDTLSLRGMEGFSRYSEELDMMIVNGVDAAHNEYLNIWVNQGGLALAAYLAVLAASAVRWWKAGGDDITAVSGAAVLFYAIQAFFSISFCAVTVFLWIALATLNRSNITVMLQMSGST